MYNYKTLVGELLGVFIAIVWIAYALLGMGSMVFLVIALAITILMGTVSGGLIALSKKEKVFKEVLSWLFGAAIAVVWIAYALLGPRDMMFLVVAISLTLVFGVISGGLIKLAANKKEVSN